MDLCNIIVIRALLERHGFKFSKALGQNFLIASWVPEQIARECLADEDSGVLEIGPGVGCLTKELSAVSGKVCAVELDKRLPDVLAESLYDCDNVEIICGDILKLDISDLVSSRFSGLTPRVCANLPYNITTPVLSKLIDSGCFESITVMIQREVAQRICALPGTPEYGAFSVYVNYYTEPEILFDVPPDCFLPRPKVTSSVIRMVKRSSPPAEVSDEKLFFRVVKAAFSQRRKTLLNALSSSFSNIKKEDLGKIIEECGFDIRIRGEVLSIEEFAALTEKIRSMTNET